MKTKTIGILAVVLISIGLATAADAPKPVKPTVTQPSPAQVLELVTQHRNLLLAESQMSSASESFNVARSKQQELLKVLSDKMDVASKSCGTNRYFDLIAASCANIPDTENKK